MFRKIIYIIAVALSAAPLFAVTVGELQPGGGTVASRGGTLAPLTLIDFSRPAFGIGNVTRATLVWTAGPAAGCEDSFEVKFFRPSETGLDVIATRGPFDSVAGIIDIPLSPAVNVQPGDYIGITQLQPVSCGGVTNARTDRSNLVGAVPSDPDSGTVSNIEFVNGLVMSVRASSEANPVHGTLPVVGSTQGSFGSLFRTAVQLTNRGVSPISGQLVFHPAGATAASTDPKYTYTLQPAQTISLDDIIAAMSTSGIGSMDIVPFTSYPPDVTARIYNDEGTGGTSGFTEEVMTPVNAMQRFERGSFTIPSDLTNFRMNIGIRTLDEGVTIQVIEYDANGIQVSGLNVARSYPPNYFEQVTLSQFLEEGVVAEGGFIIVQIQSGSAYVYASTTDNRTNDSSIRFPKKF